MCNLSGYSGLKKPNIHIIKLLAIYGRERGNDGFGIWMGDKLFKNGGYNKEGDSYNVVYGTVVEKNANTSNTVLMHNRAKSIGLVNKTNAHPYEFNHIEGKHYIFAHNGTIKNIETLCEKYKIETTVGLTDSYYLGKIIYEYGFDVLKEYEGFAAITVLDVNTDILYLFKGFSQCESNVATEERPLHIYKRNQLLYYSSEAINLSTAINTHDNIESLAPNVLFSILGGKCIKAEPYDRSHIIFKKVEYDWSNSYGSTNNYPAKSKSIEPLYKIEPTPQNKMKNKIYCWQGRYWKNGHLLRGPIMISDDEKCYSITPKELENYKLYNSDLYNNIRFFVDGYMMKDEDVYHETMKSNLKESNLEAYNWAQKLHPDTIYMKMLGLRYSMYYNGKYISNTKVIPLYSCFEYTNQNGVIKVTDIEKTSKVANDAFENNLYGDNFM